MTSMFVYRCERGVSLGTARCSFCQYPVVPLFKTLVFDEAEYSYWVPNGNSSNQQFPAPLYIKSAWEEHVILSSLPSGMHPATLTERKEGWKAALEKVEREVAKELESVEVESIDWWASKLPPSPSTVAQQAVVPAASPTLLRCPSRLQSTAPWCDLGLQAASRSSGQSMPWSFQSFVNIASCARIEGEAPCYHAALFSSLRSCPRDLTTRTLKPCCQ